MIDDGNNARATVGEVSDADKDRFLGDARALLDPRGAWVDGAEYDKTARELVNKFVENFAQFADHVDEAVRAAAPVAA